MNDLSEGVNDSNDFDSTLFDRCGQNSIEREHKAQSSGREFHGDCCS